MVMATQNPTAPFPPRTNSSDAAPNNNTTHSDAEKVLCQHCKRTATNGIRCLGMCVADNDY
jgi:hypothetical protein